MNAVAKVSQAAVALPEDEAIRILKNSLYPGARDESVRLVLAWCRANGRDPMRKPIHIVPMWVKDATTGQGAMQEVLMPGIGTYRSDAAETGQYAGKSEPEFGPEVTRDVDGSTVTFPIWCKVTVQRLVGGQVRNFTAMERWTENYASGKGGKGVNDMWRKRPYGQLGKCTEAQALRMAFPDETGNTNTEEEMQGKTFDGMTIDAKLEHARVLVDEAPAEPAHDGALEWANKVITRLEACDDKRKLMVIIDKTRADRDGMREHRPELSVRVEAAFSAAYSRLVAPTLDEDKGEFAEVEEPVVEPV